MPYLYNKESGQYLKKKKKKLPRYFWSYNSAKEEAQRLHRETLNFAKNWYDQWEIHDASENVLSESEGKEELIKRFNIEDTDIEVLVTTTKTSIDIAVCEDLGYVFSFYIQDMASIDSMIEFRLSQSFQHDYGTIVPDLDRNNPIVTLYQGEHQIEMTVSIWKILSERVKIYAQRMRRIF